MAFSSSHRSVVVPPTQHVFIPICKPSLQRGQVVKYAYKIYNGEAFASDPINHPALILANGWTATKEDFLDLPMSLIEKSNYKRTIITVDHRGIGESIIYYDNDINSHQRSKIAKEKKLGKPIPQFTISDLADDIAYLVQYLYNQHAMIDKISKKTISNFKVDILGLSMGGMIAQLFGLRYPQYTRNLILCATAPAGGKHTPNRGPKNKEFFELATSLSRCKTKEELYDKMYQLVLLNFGSPLTEKDKSKIDEMIKISQATRRPSQTVMGQANAIFNYDILKDLSKIGNQKQFEFNTLIFHGKKDNVLDYRNGEKIAQNIQNNIYIELENEGHLLYATEMGLNIVTNIIDQFLNLKRNNKRLNLDQLHANVGKDKFSVKYSTNESQTNYSSKL